MCDGRLVESPRSQRRRSIEQAIERPRWRGSPGERWGRRSYGRSLLDRGYRPSGRQSSAIRTLCEPPAGIDGVFADRGIAGSCGQHLYSRSGRHSSAVEQLFRKSLALCAVLPRVEARYKRAHLSAIRFEGLPAYDRRYGPLASKPTLSTRNRHRKVGRSRVGGSTARVLRQRPLSSWRRSNRRRLSAA